MTAVYLNNGLRCGNVFNFVLIWGPYYVTVVYIPI